MGTAWVGQVDRGASSESSFLGVRKGNKVYIRKWVKEVTSGADAAIVKYRYSYSKGGLSPPFENIGRAVARGSTAPE